VQARIAHRVYELEGSRKVNFRGGSTSSLFAKLHRAGANVLCDLMVDSRVSSFLTLLHEVRNTIHNASLSSHGYHTTGKGPGWLEIDQGAFATRLWDAASAVGGTNQWGMTKFRHRLGVDGPIVEPIRLQPYLYASQLIDEGIALVDSVAAATAVERLFNGQALPQLMDGPPNDPKVSVDMCNRVVLLG
jgi:hypothetical protein